MDTKWKNRILQIATFLLFAFGLSSIFLFINQGSTYIKKDYFQTSQFEMELHEFINHLRMFELSYVTKEEAKKAIIVTDEEINEHRYYYGDLAEQIANIRGQYDYRIDEAKAYGDETIIKALTQERDAKIEDITNNFTSDEHVRKKIIKEKERIIDDYYQELENYRYSYNNYKNVFQYYLKNSATSELFTNVEIADESVNKMFNQQDMLFIRQYPSEKHGPLSSDGYYYIGHEYEYMNQGASPVQINRAANFEGMIAIPKSASQSSFIVAQYYSFQQKQIQFLIYVISGLLALISSLYLNKRYQILKSFTSEKWQDPYRKIPIDVAALFIIITAFACLIYLSDMRFYHYWQDVLFHIIIMSLFLIITIIQVNLFVTRIKEKKKLRMDWKNSISFKVIEGMQELFLNRSFGTQMTILLGIIFVLGFGAVFIGFEPFLIVPYSVVLIVAGIPILLLLINRVGYFNRIVFTANELASGNEQPDLPIKGKSALAQLAANINTLKHGVKVSQQAQAKSERLKTELITNVSHDLRTPLTSIITYTELLKADGLSDDDKNAYVEIIDRKSKRLKVLIDDLFEATKMASGNIELIKEKVDIGQLLDQALAEYNETMEASSLHFRITKPEQPVYAVVDGQKLWRVFDNLIGNILKYSLENTRVYISIKQTSHQVEIAFKNVTKYELGGNIEEMFERFKRGDTSRHTEGSGLGLAIAKSIVDLHGGNMEIEVDGDLFKVVITL